MIKNYNQFINESILDELKGPTEEEIQTYIDSLSGSELFDYYTKMDMGKLVNYDLDFLKQVLQRGVNNTFIKRLLIDNCYYICNIEVISYLLDNFIFDGLIIQQIMNDIKNDKIKKLLKDYYKKHYSFFKRFKEYNNIK